MRIILLLNQFQGLVIANLNEVCNSTKVAENHSNMADQSITTTDMNGLGHRVLQLHKKFNVSINSQYGNGPSSITKLHCRYCLRRCDGYLQRSGMTSTLLQTSSYIKRYSLLKTKLNNFTDCEQC